jgi:hypothetical protein
MTFEDFLKQRAPDGETLQQALRLYISEITDDLPREEMRERLYAATTDAAELTKQLSHMERESKLAEGVAIAYFETAWADPDRQPSIRAAFDHAKNKLPVIEVALIALVTMYAMYLIASDGGKIEEERWLETTKDGSRQEYEKIKRERFGPIGAIIGKLFGK